MELERVSLAIEKDLIERFDALVGRQGQRNRSEAMRDLIRRRLVEEEWSGTGEVVGTVTLVYDHDRRDLADRLLEAGHTHHRCILSTLHVHLDASRCLEVTALRGTPDELRHVAQHLIGMKGVLHGEMVMTSATV